MDILAGPAIVALPDRHTAGIRVTTPFRGMFAVRDELMRELYAGLDAHGLDYGVTFFRLHVVAMEADMQVEVGVVTGAPVEPAGTRIAAGVLPAGRYATMTYVGHGRRANGTLIDWVNAGPESFDRTESPAGDRFGCRYEAYLTDPRSERMKTRWRIELAIRLRD
ncbi:GyrI-like domain-containing protein [Paractinoplanes atraurantiacus]|uniref:Effector-binding domain-containing protein n=1 Tax=Paractinoplanes atraurantiacus TaxID=1036182 RepID=A0A285IZC5_9ACTN|nr:GyrI-like domain-containing protein [Actinoplanes atraurantiacus]SNY52456.1 effector-binding domain-containing protein [Actinoplanes atraurantiacus]